MTLEQTQPIEVFCSYAPEDGEYLKELKRHLTILEREGLIKVWYDEKISAGRNKIQEIEAHLNAARLILLLISQDFISSTHHYDFEAKRALERQKAGETRIIPIILRPSSLGRAWFTELQTLPKNGQPVTIWPNRDEAFANVVKDIREVVDEIMFSSQTTSAMERPATAFLSYKHEDSEAVKYLQLQLNIRGIRVQQHVLDDGSTKDEIVYMIEQESDACVLYITHESLASYSLWNNVIPAALKRRAHNSAFTITFILQGVSFEKVQQLCSPHGYQLGKVHRVQLPNSITNETVGEFKQKLQQAAKDILKAAFDMRWRRVGADHSYVPHICFRTFNYEPSTSSLDLDLDWAEFFKGKNQAPTEAEWRDADLLTALYDVKNVLSSKVVSRRLHVFLKARLPAAFAFGFAFLDRTSFELELDDGNKENGIWHTDATPSNDILQLINVVRRTNDGDSRVAVVELAIPRPIESSVGPNLTSFGLSYSHHVQIGTKDRIKDAAQAVAVAQQIREELERLVDYERVSRIHVFALLPVNLAVMVGRLLNALRPITFYHYVSGKETYVPVCTLG